MHRTLIALAAAVSLGGCDIVASLLGDAQKQADSFLGTKNICTMAGQSETVCGCLETELGAQLTAEQKEQLLALLRASISGSLDQAADAAGSVDTKTRDALVKCAIAAPAEAPEDAASDTAAE